LPLSVESARRIDSSSDPVAGLAPRVGEAVGVENHQVARMEWEGVFEKRRVVSDADE